jgi:hypothetical protein
LETHARLLQDQSRGAGGPAGPVRLTALNPLRFDHAALKQRLRERRYRRAEAYAAGGAGRLLAVDARRVHAFGCGGSGHIDGAQADEGVCTRPDVKETGGRKHIGALASQPTASTPARRALNGRLSRLGEILSFESAEGLRALPLRSARTRPGVLEALEGDASPDD